MTQKEITNLAQKYIVAANELDKAGLTKEAIQIDREIFLAIEEKILPIKLNLVKTFSNKKNVKLAIVGQSDWNDYLENMSAGAGGGAGTALGSGIGVPFAGAAAIGGAALGGAATLGRDAMFNHLQGQTSKLESLNTGLMTTVKALAQTVNSFDPGAAQGIMQLAEGLQQNIAAVREQKRKEISQSVGLDPDKGFMQSINPLNWGKALNRKWQMITSSNTNNMTKIATDISDVSGVIDPGQTAAGLTQAIKGKGTSLLTGKGLGWGAGLRGSVGGVAGAAIGSAGYNLLANSLRGKAGILQKQIADVQKYGASLAQVSQDPSVIQITQQIAMLAQGALQAIQSGQQPTAQPQQPQQPQQQAQQPEQYYQANQSFR